MNERPAKILVVDDDLRLRQLLERYLREQGYTSRSVNDAEAMDHAIARERMPSLYHSSVGRPARN